MNFKPIKTNDPYAKTAEELILEKLKLLHLKDGDLVYDLGCGDAQALILACTVANIKAVGYEMLPEALNDAKQNIEAKQLTKQIRIKNEDFYDADISSADALILYLSRNVLGQISLKLENELKKGARIVTHDFDIPAWEADLIKEVTLKNGMITTIYFYIKK
ncbi:methyltransferase domain-containing protein [Pontimicrobium sp. MEBiC06410]